MSDKNFKALELLYNNKQMWVRHYENLLGKIIPVSGTAILSICAYLVANEIEMSTTLPIFAIGAGIFLFIAWYAIWCDLEIRAQFEQIIGAEGAMGMNLIMYQGKLILPEKYKKSANFPRPIVFSSYCILVICLLALIYTAYLNSITVNVYAQMETWVADNGHESFYPNLIGFAGILFILAAYTLVQAQRMNPNKPLYPIINIIGCLQIIYSLFYAFNLTLMVINVIWLTASVVRLMKYVFSRPALAKSVYDSGAPSNSQPLLPTRVHSSGDQSTT